MENKNNNNKNNNDSFGEIRKGFSDGLMYSSGKNENIVVLCADLTKSIKADEFAKTYPKRFFEMGISEQNMLMAACGMTSNDKIPFALSYAAFNPGRNWDQLRNGACYSKLNVKIIGGHAGLTTGPDGATHQMLEDIAITRVIPNLVVVVPCDEEETKKATIAISEIKKPCYLRLSREKSINITSKDSFFEIGKANVIDGGNDITIIACGICVGFAINARKILLSDHGISAEVINMHTIKPLDENTILESVKKTGLVITIEEHQINGGMGSAVCEFLSDKYPVKIKRLGMNDSFGESGNGYELLEKYGISTDKIVEAVLEMIKK